jgi:hypothetical protein
LFTVERITLAAAVNVSTRADEPFYRGDEPERSPSHRRHFAKVRRCVDITAMLKTRWPAPKTLRCTQGCAIIGV